MDIARQREVYAKTRHLKGWFASTSFENFVATNVYQSDLQGDILEIGCYYGQSACTLASFLKPGEKLHLNDLFDLPASKEPHNIARKGAKPVVLNVPSAETLIDTVVEVTGVAREALVPHVCSSLQLSSQLDASQRFRIIHIDGRHDFHYALMDLRLAFNYLAPGGAVILDDWRNPDWPEVGQALMELLQRKDDVVIFEADLHKCYLEVRHTGETHV